jgi:hypothetical protein
MPQKLTQFFDFTWLAFVALLSSLCLIALLSIQTPNIALQNASLMLNVALLLIAHIWRCCYSCVSDEQKAARELNKPEAP